MSSRPLVVLASFPAPRPTTNPYIVLLADALRSTPGIDLRLFSWRSALLTRFDVFHVHWPDVLLSGNSRAKTAARVGMTMLLLLKLRLLRIPIVRTAHNVGTHEKHAPLVRRILGAVDRRTAVWVAINEDTPLPDGAERRVILHGHYRGWYAGFAQPGPVPGRLAYFGLIRPYKNVEGLLQAFLEVDDRSLTLEVAGAPSAELRPRVEALAARDPRVRTSLHYVPDDELARIVGEAELVVLPYREMLNSGGLLLALSLDRPVLVPAAPANDRIAAEVGPGWVHCYDGELTPAVLTEALAAVRTGSRSKHPDLSLREWDAAGAAHAEAYRRAVELAGRRRRARSSTS